MQRVSLRASLIGLALAGGLIAAMLGAFMLTMGGQGTPKTQAAWDTPTTNPAFTPKPTPLTNPPAPNTSGVYDLWIYTAKTPVKSGSLYNCMIRQEQATDDSIKSAATCYTELNIGDLYAKPPSGSLNWGPTKTPKPVAHGADGQSGPPPPPPYTTLAPSKGFGSVVTCAGGLPAPDCTGVADGLQVTTTYTCFSNLGWTAANPLALGPNVIAKLVVTDWNGQMAGPDHKVDTALHGPLTDGVSLFKNQSAVQCANPTTAKGTPLFFHNINITNSNATDPRCNPCALAPWRHAGPTQPGDHAINGKHSIGGYPDWDGDKCTDANELFADKLGLATKCGDDPWNPNDAKTATAAGVAGIWDLVVQVKRQDVCKGGLSIQPDGTQGPCVASGPQPADGTVIPGYYFSCISHIFQDPTAGAPLTALHAKVLCYTDSPVFTVNPDMVVAPGAKGDLTCPNAPAGFCGDGSPGAAPPGCIPNGPPDTWCVQTANNPVPTPGTKAGHATSPTKGGNLPGGSNDPDLHCPASIGPFKSVVIQCKPERWLYAGIAVVGGVPHAGSSDKQTNLTGTVSQNGTGPGGGQIILEGCFNPNNKSAPFAVPAYAQAVFDFKTGHGYTSVWLPAGRGGTMTDALCKAGKPTTPPQIANAPVDLVRQACDAPEGLTGVINQCQEDTKYWDNDGDGCIDARELSDSQAGGGMRDPSNQMDFFDPAKLDASHKHNAADILAVQQAFGIHEWVVNNPGLVLKPNPNYDSNKDRTAINGSNPWNLGRGNGYVTAVDILAAQKSYGHNCPQTLPTTK
jgi:hypothetical protein